MPAIFSKYVITSGTGDTAVKAVFLDKPGKYDGAIGTDTGVSEATTDADLSLPVVSVGSLLGSKHVKRIIMRYKTSLGDTGVWKSAKLLCASTKLEALLNKYTGQDTDEYGTGVKAKAIVDARRLTRTL